MSESLYRKNQEAELDEEFRTGQPFGLIRVGKTRLFWRKNLRWRCLPICEVERAYRRIEEVNGKTGCCSNDFSIHKLILVLKNGEKKEVLIGDSLYRREPERLMEAMQQQWTQLIYGKETEAHA